MNLVWIIYFIETADSVRSIGGIVVSVAISTLVAILWIAIYNAMDKQAEKTLPTFKKLKVFHILIASLLLILFSKAIPSKDTGYKMLAAYGATELVQSEEARELGGKSLEVLNKVMDDYLKEIEK